MHRWIASGLMTRGFCSIVALAMTFLMKRSFLQRHCEGYDKCIDGNIKPEAIQ